MSTLQAPTGGATSVVNGARYEGGQFMPLIGLFCGKKGEHRKQQWAKAEAAGTAKNLGGSKLFQVRKYAGGGAWINVCVAIANSEQQIRLAMETSTRLYAVEM